MPPVVGPLIRPELVFSDLPVTDCRGVLRALAGRVVAAGLAEDAERIYRALFEREQLGSTGIGEGVAIPHCKLPGLDHGIVAVGIARPGIDFGAPDGKPVSVFFLVLSPEANPAEHLQTLARVSRWVRHGENVEALLRLGTSAAVHDYLKESL